METVTIILSLFITFLMFLYIHLKKNHNYWKSKGVKGKPPVLFFGNIKERILLKKSFHEFYKELYFDLEGEPYAGFYEGLIPVLMVRDPDLIRSVLTKDFDHFIDRNLSNFKTSPYVEKMMLLLCGSEWKRVRSSVTPTFSTGRIKGMFTLVEECALALTSYIDKLIENNGGKSTGDIDIKETFSKFTLDLIASSAFGINCNSFQHADSEFSIKIAKFNSLSMFSRLLFFLLILLDVPQQIRKLISFSFFNLETVDFLAQVVKDTTKHRRENNIRRNDFLQLLMDAQTAPIENGEGDHQKEKTELISEEVAIAQSILIFIAGYETSGTLLTMTCYELAKNVDVQVKLRAEIKNKMEMCSGKITYEQLSELPYLDMVIAETLRVHSPVAKLDRVCTKPFNLGSIHLEANTKVFIPVSGLHADPKYFPEPDLFKPERFTQEEKSKRHMYVYLPFGHGPRNCIGMRFAQMSAKLCLIHVINKYVINICPKTKIPFEYDKRSMLLKSASGVFLQFLPCETN